MNDFAKNLGAGKASNARTERLSRLLNAGGQASSLEAEAPAAQRYGIAHSLFLLAPLLILVVYLRALQQTTLGGTTSLDDRRVWMLMLASCLMGLIYQALKSNQRKSGVHGVFLIYFLLWGWLGVVSAYAGFTQTYTTIYALAYEMASSFLWLSVFLYVGAFLRSRADFCVLMRHLAGFGLLVSFSVYLGVLFFFLADIEFGEIEFAQGQLMHRFFGPFGDNVGYVICLFALLAFARGRFVTALYHVTAIGLTGTRAALLCTAFGSAVLLLRGSWLKKRGQRGSIPLAIAVGVGGLATLVFFSPYGETLRTRLFDPDNLGRGVSVRTEAYRRALAVISSSPIVGVGFCQFRNTWHLVTGSESMGLAEQDDRLSFFTQNQALQFGTDGGVIAMVLYLALALVLLLSARKCVLASSEAERPYVLAAAAYLLAILIGNQSAVWFAVSSSAGYCLLLVAGALIRFEVLTRKSSRPGAFGHSVR